MKKLRDISLKNYMNNNQVALSSMAMDLKRVALGYHRGSVQMAERFLREALKRREEIDQKSLKPYVKKLLSELDTMIQEKDQQKIAEDALMYSTLFQNASLSKT